MVPLGLVLVLVAMASARAPPYVLYIGKVLMDTNKQETLVRVHFKNVSPKTIYDIKLHVGLCEETKSEPYVHPGKQPKGVSFMVQSTTRGVVNGGIRLPFMLRSKSSSQTTKSRSVVISSPQGERVACADITKVVTQSKIEDLANRILRDAQTSSNDALLKRNYPPAAKKEASPSASKAATKAAAKIVEKNNKSTGGEQAKNKRDAPRAAGAKAGRPAFG